MSKGSKKKHGKNAAVEATAPPQDGKPAKLEKNEYEKELYRLQTELVKLQEWARETGARVVIVFEGRDAAGKGGIIKRIAERTSPRVFRVVALPAPNDREKSQVYLQRYIAHLPAGGEVVIFDRSWYNRAGVEQVMGFCSKSDYTKFLKNCPGFEASLVNDGIILLKYWLEVSEKEQHKRFEARIHDGFKIRRARVLLPFKTRGLGLRGCLEDEHHVGGA